MDLAANNNGCSSSSSSSYAGPPMRVGGGGGGEGHSGSLEPVIEEMKMLSENFVVSNHDKLLD